MQTSVTRDWHIESTAPLITPIEPNRELPVSPRVEHTVASGRAQTRKILNGEDPRFLVIVGPCSIHDEEAALDYAERLASCSSRLSDRLLIVMRAYFEKPRTTTGWKGLIYDPHLDDSCDINTGLHRARALLLEICEIGVYAGTEFLDPIIPQYLVGLVTWAAIGARTTESQTHRQMASGLSMPVGFKNATDGNTFAAINAMISARFPHCFLGMDQEGRTAIIRTKGNPDGHIVLRGGNNRPNFGPEAMAQAGQHFLAAGVRPQLIVDCSHGNSNKEHAKQSRVLKDVVNQRRAGNEHIIGCMLESNINPGGQPIEGGPSTLRYGVSVIDPCIGWEETEELLNWIYENAEQT